MYHSQKDSANEFIQQAKLDVSSNKPLEDSVVCLTTDMMQNASVPWLGAEQVCIAYYFSPLLQFVSGFVDNVTEKMNLYFLGEGSATRSQ